jgi:hypothetical protein
MIVGLKVLMLRTLGTVNLNLNLMIIGLQMLTTFGTLNLNLNLLMIALPYQMLSTRTTMTMTLRLQMCIQVRMTAMELQLVVAMVFFAASPM